MSEHDCGRAAEQAGLAIQSRAPVEKTQSRQDRTATINNQLRIVIDRSSATTIKSEPSTVVGQPLQTAIAAPPARATRLRHPIPHQHPQRPRGTRILSPDDSLLEGPADLLRRRQRAQEGADLALDLDGGLRGEGCRAQGTKDVR